MPRTTDDEHLQDCIKKEAQYNRNPDACVAAREMTVEELLDRRIDKLQSQMKALQDVKGSLSQSFLRSGASRIMVLLEIT